MVLTPKALKIDTGMSASPASTPTASGSSIARSPRTPAPLPKVGTVTREASAKHLEHMLNKVLEVEDDSNIKKALLNEGIKSMVDFLLLGEEGIDELMYVVTY